MATRSNKPGSILLCLLLPVLAAARGFTYTTPLAPVPHTGFYQMLIDPDLSAKLQTSLADLRIADDKGQLVPHLVWQRPARLQGMAVNILPVLRNTTDTARTVLEVANTAGALSSLQLSVNNADVQRQATLSGSDNRKDWYIVSDKLRLIASSDQEQDRHTQLLQFPKCSYKYLRLEIDNERSYPLRIRSVTASQAQDADYYPGDLCNPAPTLTQHDSGQASYIIITQQEPYPLSKIQLMCSGVKFFERDTRFYSSDTGGHFYQTPFCTTKLSPGLSSILLPVTIQTRKILVVIDNRDNPALHVDTVALMQRQQRVVAWLETGKSYHLLAGNADAAPPDYDLVHFRDSIPEQPEIITHTALTEIKAGAGNNASAADNKMWIWVTITVAVLLLGGISISTMRDMQRKGM